MVWFSIYSCCLKFLNSGNNVELLANRDRKCKRSQIFIHLIPWATLILLQAIWTLQCTFFPPTDHKVYLISTQISICDGEFAQHHRFFTNSARTFRAPLHRSVCDAWSGRLVVSEELQVVYREKQLLDAYDTQESIEARFLYHEPSTHIKATTNSNRTEINFLVM